MDQNRKPAEFQLAGKRIIVYASENPGAPAVYLNAFNEEEGDGIRQALSESNCPDHSLVVIDRLDWNHDMAPWDCPALWKKSAPMTGGAAAYLRVLTETIVPAAEEKLPAPPAWRGLAGYSLAGLFAVWSIHNTDVFSRFASASGSLWFPDFVSYAKKAPRAADPACIYFSLGDKESRTRNTVVMHVQENTEALAQHYRAEGIPAVFELNQGGHLRDPEKRTAAGIRWILEF